MAFGFPARFTESRKFFLQEDELVAVAESALGNLGWPYEVLGGKEFQARVQLSGWSWGEVLNAKILPGGVIQAESKSVYLGQWVDFGKNRRNIETFFAFVDHGIGQGVYLRPISTINQESAVRAVQAVPQRRWAGTLFGGCLITMLILTTLIYFISAVVGLLTGHLFLPGRGHSVTIHGVWARIISVIILGFFAWILVWVLRNRRKDRP